MRIMDIIIKKPQHEERKWQDMFKDRKKKEKRENKD
jgi:hypothetical protein